MGWNTVIEVERATTFLSSLEDRQDLQNTKTTKTQNLINAAGPTSFEDYFQKGALGSKSGTKSFVRRYQAEFAKNCSREFEGLSYLAY